MAEEQRDFLEERIEETYDKDIFAKPRKKRFFVGKFFVYGIIALLLWLGVAVINAVKSGITLSESLGQANILTQIKHLVTSEDRKLVGEETDRINILLLGMGGFGHDGPLLTDTVMIASFKPSTKQVGMISVPRDLVIQLPGFGWNKVNHAYAYAESSNPGKGIEYAADVVGQTFDIPVHYTVAMDFAGFEDFIDALGGINVDVENTFDDFRYPIPGKETATTSQRYEHLHFDAGMQKMDGETALKFARSRYASFPEGSDFARSKRQQRILVAVQNKLLDWKTFFSPKKVNNITESLADHLFTDLEIWEMMRLYELGKDIDLSNVNLYVLDNSPEGLLVEDTGEDGAFLLRPKAGNYSQLQLVAQSIFNVDTIELDTELKIEVAEKPGKEQEPEIEMIDYKKEFKIEIQNGTFIGGLAGRTQNRLESLGYQVLTIGNADEQNYLTSVIYDLSPDIEKGDELENLAQELGAEVITNVPAKFTSASAATAATDVLIILGTDQQ